MHVFTSPESARKFQEAAGADASDEENIRPSSGEPPRKKRKRTAAGASKSVAKRIGMRRATGRSIAYAAVLVRRFAFVVCCSDRCLFVPVSIASTCQTRLNGSRPMATSTMCYITTISLIGLRTPRGPSPRRRSTTSLLGGISECSPICSMRLIDSISSQARFPCERSI